MSLKKNKIIVYQNTNFKNPQVFDSVESFQKRYRSFVEKNALPKKDGDKTEIRYYATVAKIIEKHPTHIGGQNAYIWTNDHVKSYLKGKKARIWILRVYKLKEPYLAESKFGAIKYAKLSEDVSLEGIKPVLSDLEFDEMTKNLM